MIRYCTTLHQMFPNGQKGKTKSVAVNGMQNNTNSKSAIARLMIRMFVVDLIPGLAATTRITNEFPASPRIPINPKNKGTTTTTILCTSSRSNPNSVSSQFPESVVELQITFMASTEFDECEEFNRASILTKEALHKLRNFKILSIFQSFISSFNLIDYDLYISLHNLEKLHVSLAENFHFCTSNLIFLQLLKFRNLDSISFFFIIFFSSILQRSGFAR